MYFGGAGVGGGRISKNEAVNILHNSVIQDKGVL